ncbi:hypothetical protein BC826DRAFT_656880 [Russula brevipes]|nr:hypothetical protein BC826DRAFT_656880 [Russula brevipes]
MYPNLILHFICKRRETMSRRSVDIVDQWQMEPAIVEDTPPSYGEIEVQDEDPPDKRRPLLGIKLTGCRLVNMSIILVFGIWKAVLSYRGQSAAPTTLEFVAGTLLALIVYYVGQFQEERPETCPYFFEYDLTRDNTFVIILAALRYALLFMLRARVHLWVCSGPSESNIAETVTLIVAVSPLIGILGTLQQSFCILHRLRGFQYSAVPWHRNLWY